MHLINSHMHRRPYFLRRKTVTKTSENQQCRKRMLGLPWCILSATVSPMPPGFSWDTLPVHWFSSNATHQLGAQAAQRIARRHSLVIINGQSHAYFAKPSGRGSEAKMVEAGRRIKKAASELGIVEPSVLAYFNSIVDWTAYDFHW